MQAAEDDSKKQMIKAKEEEPANQVDMMNNTVLKIYEILDDVAKGAKTLRVRVDNYGLTGDNKPTKSSQGGVNGLSGNLSGNASDILNDAGVSSSGTTNSTGSGFGGNGTSSTGSGFSGNGTGSTVTSLGGWTVG
jgi:hypothetical protein